jgi:hypothetical protein
MFKVRKSLVLDEAKRPYAVQVPIEDFERMEEAIENYGLAKLMDERTLEKPLGLSAAKKYYKALKKSNVDR